MRSCMFRTIPFVPDVVQINLDAQQNKMVVRLMIAHHLISIVCLSLVTMRAMYLIEIRNNQH